MGDWHYIFRKGSIPMRVNSPSRKLGREGTGRHEKNRPGETMPEAYAQQSHGGKIDFGERLPPGRKGKVGRRETGEGRETRSEELTVKKILLKLGGCKVPPNGE